MSNNLSIADHIIDFLSTSNEPALFAGAGVSVRAGLCDWLGFMKHLSAVANKYDSKAAELIDYYSKESAYVNAATRQE